MATTRRIYFSHSRVDARIARAIQKALERLGKRLFGRPRRTVFFAQDTLPGDPRDAALSLRCEYFVFFASPAAAESGWLVAEAVEWLRRNGPERFIVLLVDGANLSDWLELLSARAQQDTPFLVPARIPQEPLFIDLRFATNQAVPADHPQFVEAVTTLASIIDGVPRAALLSGERIGERRAQRVLTALAAVLVLVIVAAALAAAWALRERQRAAGAITRAEASRSDAILAQIKAQAAEQRASEQLMELKSLRAERYKLVELSKTHRVVKDLLDKYREENAGLRREIDARRAPSGVRKGTRSGSEHPELLQRIDQLTINLNSSEARAHKSETQAASNSKRVAELDQKVAESEREVAKLMARAETLEFAKKELEARLAEGSVPILVYQYLERNSLFLSQVIAGTALVVLLSTRWVLVLLQINVWPITHLAVVFYATPPGRWRLFRNYRRKMHRLREVAYHVTHYVDLPFRAERAEGATLMQAVVGACTNGNVTIYAEGGRGKTTLCYCIARWTLTKRIHVGRRRRLEPVIVDGLSYSGDLVESVVMSLRQHGAYVNRAIVEAQLATGRLLVIFDGLSEIREGISDKSQADLPNVVRLYANSRFVFTSRGPAPGALDRALAGAAILLQDLTADNEEAFLLKYLVDRKSMVQDVLGKMKLITPPLPRIPLLMKLIATVYEEDGDVPNRRVTLFERYIDHVFRIEATGGYSLIGLKIAVRTLVRSTFLESGGDRGMTVGLALRTLQGAKDELEAVGVKRSALDVIDVLTLSGVYRQNGEYLRVFHDSFESYFGALALATALRERQTAVVLRALENPRLKEACDFLKEMLTDAGEVERLKSVEQDVRQIAVSQ